MREVFEGDHSLNYGADDEHYIVYPKVKILSELYKKKLQLRRSRKRRWRMKRGKNRFLLAPTSV